jgi:hypothetical protein
VVSRYIWDVEIAGSNPVVRTIWAWRSGNVLSLEGRIRGSIPLAQTKQSLPIRTINLIGGLDN